MIRLTTTGARTGRKHQVPLGALDIGGRLVVVASAMRFCTALTRHHTGEAGNIFPLLAGRFPALAPTLAKLDEEHIVVARLQEEVRQLVEEEADPVRLRAEFDRLRSALDDHFAYEERTLVAALNALLPAPG
ncbi:hemerythrin domain-containing protein [Amycolatopsis sp. NPDC005003]